VLAGGSVCSHRRVASGGNYQVSPHLSSFSSPRGSLKNIIGQFPEYFGDSDWVLPYGMLCYSLALVQRASFECFYEMLSKSYF